MGLMRTSHAVYDTKYHFVLRGDVRERVKELFQEIAEHHEFFIDTLEIAPERVHIFLSFPPRYSISKVAGMLKSISANEIFKEHPEVKKQLWGGEFWEDGYFVRTVGDKVTAEAIIRSFMFQITLLLRVSTVKTCNCHLNRLLS